MGLDMETGLEWGKSATPVAHPMSSLIPNPALLELFYLKIATIFSTTEGTKSDNPFFFCLPLLPFFSIIHDQQNGKNISHLPAGCRDIR